MLDQRAHPNTRTMLEAWRRMDDHQPAPTSGSGMAAAAVDATPLIANMFVLRASEAGWRFRTAGDALTRHFGKSLCEEDFLDLWLGADRGLATSILQSVCAEGNPGLIRARGETLTGRVLSVEIALAPLAPGNGWAQRILGHYQPLGGETFIGARPLWRHTISEVIAPRREIRRSHLRLVSSRD